MTALVSRKLPSSCMLAGLVLAGCNQADYSADIINRTPQPVHAQLFKRGEGSQAVLGTYRRIAAGDRALVGPVRNNVKQGAFLTIDSLGNPTRPITMDLQPGQTFWELVQEGQGQGAQFRLVEKPPAR